MKFPRNARVFRGQLDAAPFASVFFLLVMFFLLGALIYTPGVHIQLPVADDLPGVAGPTISVAMDFAGRFYFENQGISESELKTRLQAAAKRSPEPLTLVIYADKAVAWDDLLHLTLLARDAGIRDSIPATLPRAFARP